MSRLVRALVLVGLTSHLAACASSGPPASPAEGAPPPAQEGFVDAGGGVELFYRVVGDGPESVVVIHGGPGFTMDYLAADLEPLAERFSVVFYDQRGTGRSSLVSHPDALDGQRFAEDLEALRVHLGLERLTLLGHSWGPAVAALYAARYPERVGRLVIVSTIPLRRQELVAAFDTMNAGRHPDEQRRMQELREARLADPADAALCRAYYEVWFQPFYGDSAAASRGQGDFCAGSPEALRNKAASVDRYTLASLGEWDLGPSLRAVTAPALVIHGTADPLPLDGARGWAEALPNGRLLVLEGIGHFPYLEAPEAFFPAVEEFLQGRWPEGAEVVKSPR